MRWRKPLLIVVVVCALVLVAGAILLLRPRNRLITRDDFKGIVFHRQEAAQALGSMLVNDPSRYWTPTPRDITQLEAHLRAYVLYEYPQVAPDLSTYTRQYFGFVRQGTPRIFVVGFCNTEGLDWKHRFVSTAESVECHFEAEYDITAGRISSFWILDSEADRPASLGERVRLLVK